MFKVFNGQCQWCREPLNFQNFHVDHVLPEELLNDTGRLKDVLEVYGLDGTFNINDYENWIPSHPYCNQRKGKTVYEGLPLIKTILDSCAKNKERAQRMEMRLNQEPKKAEILAKVQAAISFNLINLQELQSFVLNTDIMDSDDEDFKRIGQDLAQRIEYQTEKMIKGILEMVENHAIEVIRSVSRSLGRDWSVASRNIIIPHPEDNAHTIRYWLDNKVDSRMNVYIYIVPAIVDNKLSIKFRTQDEIFDELVLNISKGIDWNRFRSVLKSHYKDFLTINAKKLKHDN